ncbi:GAF domain-containing SpoIIE family protein phosphatase [Herpetosiphon sp.]|nr:GAF domain-containing SpoIIE family protein phosphatase [Herpetosiphon sp.]
MNMLLQNIPAFETIATAWLKTGIQAFGLWVDSRYQQVWPPSNTITTVAFRAPLVVNGQAIGELHIASDRQNCSQERLDADAGLLAALLQYEHNVHLLTDELIDCQDQLVTLYDIWTSMGQHGDLTALMQSLMREVVRLTKTSNAWISFASGLGVQHIITHGFVPISEQMLRSIQTNQFALFTKHDPICQHLDIVNLLWMPITIRSVIIAGGLGICNKTGEFSATDIKFVQAICEHISLQLEQQMLYQESLAKAQMESELALAQRVQQRLLSTPLPSVADIQLTAHAKPARIIGGDFYDVLQRPDGSVAIMVGDVVGKGVAAALLMMLSRTALRNAALATHDPAAILERTNMDLYDDLTTVGVFITVFVAIYHPKTHMLWYANAGHAPVLIFRNQQTQLLEADCPPIGVLPQLCAGSHAQIMNPGDILIGATDGFNETHNQYQEMFGYQRLCQLLTQHHELSATALCNLFFQQVEAFGNSCVQEDDRTMIILKTNP